MELRAILLGVMMASSLVTASSACGPTLPQDNGLPGGRAATESDDPNATSLMIPPIQSDAGSGIATSSTTSPVTEARDTRGPLLVSARDPRLAKRRPRSRALVVTEAQGLEQLLNATKPGAPDRPAIRRRLAEDFNELAMTSSGQDATTARVKSIEQYAAIRNESPSYAQIDEVDYYLGLAYELNGDKMSARKSYYELIKSSPQSKLIPLAYFAFGEMFFTEAASDPTKNELAKQAFMEVLKYPASSNGVYPDALLRIGETYSRLGDDAKAKEMFARLQSTFPDSQAAAELPSARVP